MTARGQARGEVGSAAAAVVSLAIRLSKLLLGKRLSDVGRFLHTGKIGFEPLRYLDLELGHPRQHHK